VAALAGVAYLTDSDEALPDQARQTIEDSYFKAVPGDVLDNASIQGMVDELRHRYHDRFSHYFDPRSLAEFERATSGEFSGVGLTVNEVPRGLRVATVFPDTPAERAGMDQGDLIVAVDGRSIAGAPAEISTARIKGPPGTDVHLRVVSAETGESREVTVERASVHIPAVQGQIRRVGGERIAYVHLASFTNGAHAELRSEIEGLRRRGAEGLILDLRGNGGGLLNEAVLTASIFVPEGETVVTTESRSMGHREYDAVGDSLDPQPTVVLINRDTASAAEILTAALADHGLARVVGTRSYGKGTFQEVIRLPAGGALDLTVGEYLAANGESLLGKGVHPDVHAADEPGTRADEGLRRGLAVLNAQLNG
jgi:carboxyl-terminal processing protease